MFLINSKLNQTYFYTTTTADNVEYRIEDKAVKLRPNENIDIRFYVKFNPSMRTPMIQEIRLNGQNICSDTRFDIYFFIHLIIKILIVYIGQVNLHQ